MCYFNNLFHQLNSAIAELTRFYIYGFIYLVSLYSVKSFFILEEFDKIKIWKERKTMLL